MGEETKMAVETFAVYSEKQKCMGICVYSPSDWWAQWLTEVERGELINRLPQDHRKYAREYGLARTWNLIAPTVQAELLALD